MGHGQFQGGIGKWVGDRFQVAFRHRQVAPIANRLCRRLVAGLAPESPANIECAQSAQITNFGNILSHPLAILAHSFYSGCRAEV
jgi:hypothetical protein